jgi:hypothetical protein
MTTNSIASILSLGAILIFMAFLITPFSYANYDELPVLDNISAIAIYDLITFSVSLPSEPSQADYNITDPNFISLIYSGLSKHTSTMIDKIMAINVGVIYLKTNSNNYIEIGVFDDWKYLYVYSDGPSNNIFYEISPDIKDILIANAHQ